LLRFLHKLGRKQIGKVLGRVFKHDIRDNSLYRDGMARPASNAGGKDKVEGLGLWIYESGGL